MDAGTKSLLNTLLSVLAPVIILDHCSTQGPAFYQLGSTGALCLALCLPIACGIYSFIDSRKVESITLFGLLGTLLTGVVSLYAATGNGEAIRPDTPWWYAAKEALIPLLLCGAVLITAKRPSSLLRSFVYSDSIFDVPAIEKSVREQEREEDYNACLWKANLMMAGSFVLSALGNFGLALYFLLPVLRQPAQEQALQYNYAVSSMTWWGFLVIGLPLLLTLVLIIRYLLRRLAALSGLPQEKLTMR